MSDKKSPETMTAAEMLFDARTNGRRKRELNTISRQLCIKEEFLAALESGDYNKIPELVYILGFARNYAMELGLDPSLIVKKIKAELGIEPAEEQTVPTLPGAEDKPVINRSFITPMKRFFMKSWKIIAIVVAVILIAGTVVLVATRQQPEVVEPVQVETIAMPEFNLPIKNEFGTENKDAATVIVQANNETWLKVEDARGETLFSRVLVPGDVYFAPAAGAKATVGNAGGLDVFVNSKPVAKLGAAGVKKTGVVLSPEALSKSAE